ncbi:MAG: hypothetical protein NZ661_02370 [Candidatus Kapabacteria bacterium]|nr:hypothetical protein [Candidatus Kapabacteria bacterium]
MALSSASIVSCTVLWDRGVEIPTGKYVGEYTILRTAPADTTLGGNRVQSTDVTMLINAEQRTYRCAPVSDSSILAASNGVYALAHTRITFTDRSSATLARDASRVIQGQFSYTFDGIHLIMKQTDAQTQRERSFFLLRK